MEKGRPLRAQALALLAHRDHSRAELRRKLELRADPGEDLDGLLDQLEQQGYLSDLRFSEQLAHRHRGRHGPARLEHTLRRKGIPQEAIDAVVIPARADAAVDALAVLRRRFAGPPAGAREWLQQARYLGNRGFDSDVIRRVLSGGEPADAD